MEGYETSIKSIKLVYKASKHLNKTRRSGLPSITNTVASFPRRVRIEISQNSVLWTVELLVWDGGQPRPQDQALSPHPHPHPQLCLGHALEDEPEKWPPQALELGLVPLGGTL